MSLSLTLRGIDQSIALNALLTVRNFAFLFFLFFHFLFCVLNLKHVLNWANVCSPNILQTVRRTMIHFLIELLVR